MKTWYRQKEWDSVATEIRHPYYGVGEEIRKVMDGKEAADAAFGLTEEEKAAPDDAVFLDPLDEKSVCIELIEAAVGDYIRYRTEVYREKHAALVAEGLDVVVDENYDEDDRVIGFRLSMDSDNRSHGVDETEGAWR